MNLWSHEWKADLAELSKSGWFLWIMNDAAEIPFLKTQLHIWCKCVLFASVYYFLFVGLFTFNVICKGSASWIHCFMNATEFLVTAEFPLSVAPQTITNNKKSDFILPGIIEVLSCNIWYLADEIKMKFTKSGKLSFTTTKS